MQSSREPPSGPRAGRGPPRGPGAGNPGRPSNRGSRPQDDRRDRSRSPFRAPRDRDRSRSPGYKGDRSRRRSRSPPHRPNGRSDYRGRSPPRGPNKGVSRRDDGRNGYPTAQPVRAPLPDEEEDPEAYMKAVMGFGGFRTTKNSKVAGNDSNYAARIDEEREYRQYMNRSKGFNRPLSPTRGKPKKKQT